MKSAPKVFLYFSVTICGFELFYQRILTELKEHEKPNCHRWNETNRPLLTQLSFSEKGIPLVKKNDDSVVKSLFSRVHLGLSVIRKDGNGST